MQEWGEQVVIFKTRATVLEATMQICISAINGYKCSNGISVQMV